MTTTTTNTTLPFPVRFYSPTSPAPDSSGRTLPSILTWPDSTLEYSHDYIQNLFPLPERSPINPSAPIIAEQTFRTFRSTPHLQTQLRRSLKRMLAFYGFRLLVDDGEDDNKKVEEKDEEKATCQVLPADNFPAASEHWVTRFNHNHLRITRIIRSCRVLGLEDEALAFYGALMAIAGERRGVFSRKTLMFWRRAAERPLHLAPEDEDGDEDAGRGLDWLVDV
ncbi:MAG: hypothetical protein LQ339_002059 [Xanthoria mediterranea]|nr:MAG: hypothetical protein LQ339_002059 [Xanthoria mediterranea]